jgi:hypothetical protein
MSLRQYQQNGRRSPHKPLLVLLALGRLARTGSSEGSMAGGRTGTGQVYHGVRSPGADEPLAERGLSEVSSGRSRSRAKWTNSASYMPITASCSRRSAVIWLTVTPRSSMTRTVAVNSFRVTRPPAPQTHLPIRGLAEAVRHAVDYGSRSIWRQQCWLPSMLAAPGVHRPVPLPMLFQLHQPYLRDRRGERLQTGTVRRSTGVGY